VTDTIETLADEYWTAYLADNPTQAHLLGHYPEQGRFEDASRATEDRVIATQRDLARRAEALDPATLTDDDLSRLAMAAYLVGRRDDAVRALQRCFQLRIELGRTAGAVRCAFWLGMVFSTAGERAYHMPCSMLAKACTTPIGSSDRNSIIAKPMLSSQKVQASSLSLQASRRARLRKQNSSRPMPSIP